MLFRVVLLCFAFTAVFCAPIKITIRVPLKPWHVLSLDLNATQFEHIYEEEGGIGDAAFYDSYEEEYEYSGDLETTMTISCDTPKTKRVLDSVKKVFCLIRKVLSEICM
ncbi:hypothetical protein QR680_005021 [Steinernema hermaphroditum]|uniref:Uncharacterized protein n=1 Tax=Steinernema hermaphroditum TaxID=289476 RepID=A0AA39HQL2_9BILA|nr:hypothetical protein QR680_005021 [Steinernema hermaphroditum]